MPRTSHAQRDDKRAQILAAAMAAFAEKGFHGTRVSDVARRAGVADGTIYLYFANKNELLETIFEETLRQFLESGAEELFADADPSAQMQRLVGGHLQQLGAVRDRAAVFQIDLRHSQHFLGEVSRRVLRRYLDLITDIVQRGQATGVFDRNFRAQDAATMVFGVLDQLATSWVLSRRNYRLESQAPAASRFVLQALGVGSASA